MCGIAGFLKTAPLSADDVHHDLPAMVGALRHRGPDDDGSWYDVQAGIALAHRRLSIIDLSALGHQPMTSASGRYVIAYNGEIYNFAQQRAELLALGHSFRGGSDTEVLLAAIECWGVAKALERSWGMFAFALWDRQERTLYLARDRFGEKPLYFGLLRNALLFGSELKALREHATWSDEIDRSALALLMQHDFVPGPASIFRDVRKLMPGRFVAARARGASIQIEEHRYWYPEVLFERAAQERPQLTAEESLELTESALSHAIRRQMVADVPVGAFLSGGTDSSLVVALMQKSTPHRVKTFSIGFEEPEFDEAPFARAVARHLGTEHTEYTVTPRDCFEAIPKLPRIYDEPFADPSQIPTALVCQLARREVTVALSGDGGDELFGGYGRYANAMAKWRVLQRVPALVRAGGSALIGKLPTAALDLAARPAAWLLGGSRKEGLAHRLRHYSSHWTARSQRDFYRLGMRRWYAPAQPVVGAHVSPAASPQPPWPSGTDDLKQMMYLDTCCYLPDDILVKVDRAAMAVSLETRVPLLDVEVAHAAWRIPSAVLMHDGRGKWVLRELLRRHVPAELVDRRKRGFAVPLAKWLRADLRAWAGELLDPQRMRREGFLDPTLVQHRWEQHLSGQADWSQHLWNVLMFQAWLEEWRHSGAGAQVRAKAS